MIPIRLDLTNFLPYKEPAPLDFTGIHVAVLAGENGAGKSSLLDAITWAVWGRARAKTDNELVHQGQTEMRVEFTFALGEQLYRIFRGKRIGKGASTVLDFQVLDADGRWNSIAEATIPKTQEKIVRLLRLTYETFINSAYLMQGKADEFTGKRPTERKQVLADILGLQEWELYEERAKEKIKNIDHRLTGLDAVLNEIETELERRSEYEHELTQAQAEVIEVGERLRQAEAGWAQIDAARQAMIALERQVDDLSKRVRDAEKEIATLDADLNEARSRADGDSLTRELRAVQEQLQTLGDIESRWEAINQSRRSVAENIARLRGENEAMEREANALKRRADTLAAATKPHCPVCDQPLAESDRKRLVKEINTDVETRRTQYRENQTQVKTLTDEQLGLDKSLARANTDADKKLNLVKRAAELQAAFQQASEARERAAVLAERRERWVTSLAADRAQHEKLDAEAEQYTTILRDSAAKQQALDRLRQDDTLAKARLGATQQKLAALENLFKQRDAKRAGHNQLADERGMYEELREAFGKKGVPALMIEAAVPEIETSANALLTRMTAGRMNLRFNTQRETQAGETRETLDIQISDELGTRAYEMYSGGEAFRINFAVRVALSQLLARRAGTQLQTLFIDEGFGVLDSVGRERLVEAINAAQSDFQRIIVVTHIDELKDAFPARIEVMKGADGSEIFVR